jgi:small subunit ribosomal protein S21
LRGIFFCLQGVSGKLFREGGVKYNMVFVKVRDGETIEEALRRFKRECERNGIMQEIKRREHYEPPSVKRKRKQAEARRKMRRRMMRQNRG